MAGDGKTAIKLTINRYNQPIGVNYLQTINPVRLTNDTRLWTDGNRDLVPQLDELGPSTGFNLGTTNRFADDLKWPYAVEYSIGVQRSLPYEMVAGVTYINRQRGNEIGSRNLAVPTDTYIPLTVHRGQQRRHGHRLRSGALAARQVRRAVRQLLRDGHRTSTASTSR